MTSFAQVKNSSLIMLNWQIDKNILVVYGTLHILLYDTSDPENSKKVMKFAW